MTFLNATLIFGLAAASVPVVLHLLARREPRKVVFPSVAFLTKRFETNRSRLRLRRLWLLALRIGAIAALAFALARPAIHRSVSVTWLTIGLIAALGVALLVMATVAISKSQSKATSTALGATALLALLLALVWGVYPYVAGPAVAIDSVEPVAIAIVLDNSPSSAWKTVNDDRLARMKDLATWMVTRIPPTSRIAIIDRSAQPASFSIDVAGAVSKIEQLRAREVVQPIASRIEAATRLVRTSELSNRQVFLVTDFAQSSWNQEALESGLAAVLTEEPAVSITAFDLGEFDGVNRSLAVPQFVDATPPRGVPVALSTTLKLEKTDADNPSVSVTAELELFENDPTLPVVRNGKIARPKIRSVDRTSVRVAKGGSSELLMTIPSLEVGTHHGRVRLVGEDAISIDNERYFTLRVLPASRVLLVCDDEDESRIIMQTITAAAGLVDPADAEFQVEQIEFSDLSVVRLADFEAVLLLDPPNDAITDEAVVEYAEQGGGVLVCLGPAADDEVAESPLVPKMIRRWRSPEPGTFFQMNRASHPVTEPVSADTPWADFRVSQYWQVEAGESDSVLATYAGTGHPAIVQRLIRAGTENQALSGRSLVLTTPLPALSKETRSWNELFGSDPWPAWLLTRQCVEFLTGRGGEAAMTKVGLPQVIAVNEGNDSDQPNQPEPSNEDVRAKRIQLFPPGDTSPVPLNIPADANSVTVQDVSRSGVYWIRGLDPGLGFSANMPSDAIDLNRIDLGQLDQIFGPDQYRLATSREEIEFAENQSSQRVSLHSPAMLLALVIFLLEQVLGNRFYRSK